MGGGPRRLGQCDRHHISAAPRGPYRPRNVIRLILGPTGAVLAGRRRRIRRRSSSALGRQASSRQLGPSGPSRRADPTGQPSARPWLNVSSGFRRCVEAALRGVRGPFRRVVADGDDGGDQRRQGRARNAPRTPLSAPDDDGADTQTRRSSAPRTPLGAVFEECLARNEAPTAANCVPAWGNGCCRVEGPLKKSM